MKAEEVGYLLGAIAGDCFIGKYKDGHFTIRLQTTSKLFAEKFKSILEKVVKKKVHYWQYIRRISDSPKKESKIFDVELHSKKWVEFFDEGLENLNCLSKKPKIGFLEGLFDAEGCFLINKKNPNDKRVLISNNNKNLLIEAKNVLFNLGIPSKIRSSDDKHYLLGIYKQKDINKFIQNVNSWKFNKGDNC